MDYIVLDMEWNQPWPGSPSSKKVLPVQIRGEIIQIGAVRVTQEQLVMDEFQVLVKPKFYRRLNRRVSKLTGIKEAQLRDNGVPFPDAIRQFRAWCGEDVIFRTWGFDDITILRENLRLYGIDEGWTGRWYNAQMIFNAQTDGATAQKALKTAMQMAGVEASRPAHDALGDAYHTAIVCTRLDLPRGMAEYGTSVKQHEDGFHGAEIPGCIARKVFHGFDSKEAAMEALGGRENLCPQCEARMSHGKWVNQQSRRYATMCTCPNHGTYLVRVRLAPDEDSTIKVVRLIYEGDSAPAKAFAEEKPKPKVRKRRSRSKVKR